MREGGWWKEVGRERREDGVSYNLSAAASLADEPAIKKMDDKCVCVCVRACTDQRGGWDTPGRGR